MTLDTEEQTRSDATTLCKACGLCCTGHFFSWAKLKSTELKTAAELGLHVLGSEPGQRGFNQPCPLWDGECTIYSSPHYPHFCGLYKCSLLKKVLDERVSLTEALSLVQQTKEMIAEVESMLPRSSNRNFRDRLVQALENENPEITFRKKVHDLLFMYEHRFGVKDLIDHSDEATDCD